MLLVCTEHFPITSGTGAKPCIVNVELGKAQVNCKMKLDTAASRSTVSRHGYDSTLSSYPLRDAGVI